MPDPLYLVGFLPRCLIETSTVTSVNSQPSTFEAGQVEGAGLYLTSTSSSSSRYMLLEGCDESSLAGVPVWSTCGKDLSCPLTLIQIGAFN